MLPVIGILAAIAIPAYNDYTASTTTRMPKISERQAQSTDGKVYDPFAADYELAAHRDPASPRPPEPEEAGTSKPRFDFYTILPEREVKVPEWDVTPLPEPKSPPESKRPPAAVPPSGPEASGSYMIKLGSFQGYQDADRVKARLALAGVSAGIQRVVINGSDIWYRVRVGPFNDLKSLQGARQRLTEGRFNYMLVKVKLGEGAG